MTTSRFLNFRTVDNPKLCIIASCSKLEFESVSLFFILLHPGQSKSHKSRDNPNLEMKSNVRAVTPKPEDKPESVDREKTCPLLLRVFTNKGMKISAKMTDKIDRFRSPSPTR